MKVIILAGGWGTMLGKQTEDLPKPMLLIGNKPNIVAYYNDRNNY